jgi:hypothetical protein
VKKISANLKKASDELQKLEAKLSSKLLSNDVNGMFFLQLDFSFPYADIYVSVKMMNRDCCCFSGIKRRNCTYKLLKFMPRDSRF